MSNAGNRELSEIKLPKNIKQIGDVDSDKKIYIEDYAYTYINSVAHQKPDKNQAGILLGENMRNKSESCIFIKGVIKARFTGEIHFNDEIWAGIYQDIDQFFPGLHIVGWFAAMPEVTNEQIKQLTKIHKNNFLSGTKTLCLVDNKERSMNFFLYEKDRLKKQSGYVCFYERNYEMQEYMLETGERKSIENPKDNDVVKSIRAIIQEKENMRYKRKGNFTSYFFGIIVMASIVVIGFNLVQNYERMEKLDNSLSTIVQQVSNLNNKGTQSVMSDGIVPVDVVYETKSNTSEKTTPTASIAPSSANQSETAKLTDSTNQSETSQKTETTKPTQNTKPTEPTKNNDETKQTSVVSLTEPQSYVVKKGDTIISICKSYYGNIDKVQVVADYNNIDDINKLYIGQVIKLP